MLQQWYGLSDPGLEEALLDRVSFRRFCGFALEEETPDETTICRFRNALKEAGLGEALFGEVVRQLDQAGFLVKSGTLIDASLVERAVRRPPDGSTPRGEESRSPHDPDANWMRHGNTRQLFFGYTRGRGELSAPHALRVFDPEAGVRNKQTYAECLSCILSGRDRRLGWAETLRGRLLCSGSVSTAEAAGARAGRRTGPDLLH